MLKRVRGICASWPEVEEIVDGFGHHVLKARGNTFVMMGEHEGAASHRRAKPAFYEKRKQANETKMGIALEAH